MTQVFSRLGTHCTGPHRDGFRPYLQTLFNAGRRPAVVDNHGDFGSGYEAIEIDPATLTIGTLVDSDADFDINELRRVAALNKHIKFWQIYNEINGDWVGQTDRLIEYMTLYGNEFKFVIYNCAEGTPQYPEIDPVPYAQVARACAVAKAGGHMLGLHEYGDTADTDILFRYRRLAEYLRERDALCPIVITEAGPSKGSWVGDIAFINWCRMYDAGLMQDSYIVGAALWSLGGVGWGGVNFETALPELAEYQATVEPVQPPIPPEHESGNGTFAALPSIWDAQQAEWYLEGVWNPEAGWPVMKNGAPFAGGYAEALLYWQGAVYCTNAKADWYRAETNGWSQVAEDPRLTVVVPPEPQEPFWCSWPIGGSETPRITDKFNAPRSYANGKHEGTDGDGFINATGKMAPVIAAQDGIVEMVRSRGDNPSYGHHVVVRHSWGTEPDRYRTLYAHLSRIDVVEGQTVKRGDPIGLAGRTGTNAIHLHFGVYDTVKGLKGYVRCSDCSGTWPEGVINPESVLRLQDDLNPLAWRGLQMRADGNSNSADLEALRVAKCDAAKIMSNTSYGELDNLFSIGIKPERIVLRLFAAGDNPALKNSAQFFNEQMGWLTKFASVGGRFVEIHNEPNHPSEGMGTAWKTAFAFGAWYEGVARLIRTNFPRLSIGWPGLWPDAASAPDFIGAMKASIDINLVDWIGAHSYWGNAAGVDDPENGRWYRRLLGLGRPVIITEFSNNQAWDSDEIKGAQYKRYYATLDEGVVGAFAFVSSASAETFNTRRETWVRNGTLCAIPGVVGT